MTQDLTTYPGAQLALTHAFANPDRPGSAAVPSSLPRFRVWGPEGRLMLDSSYYTGTDKAPAGVAPGQVLDEGQGRYTLLWSVPEDAPTGRYMVEAGTTINDYPYNDTVAVVTMRSPLKLKLEALVQPSETPLLAYSCWFNVRQATQIRLLRELWLMIQADQTRRDVDPGAVFAFARHESGEQTDLLPLSAYTLKTGWTHVTVSAGLFQLPAVDRLYQPVGYGGSSGDRYGNPYWHDGTVYDLETGQGQSPLAFDDRFGPGPLHYLYLSDPHWGCRDYKCRWTQYGRLQADPTSPVTLEGSDARRLELVCLPDFAGKIAFFAYARPAERVTLEELSGARAYREYVMAYDSGKLWTNYIMAGPGNAHTAFAPELTASGPSHYYRIDTEVVRHDPVPGSTNRFLLGHDMPEWDGKSPLADPSSLIRIV